MFIRMVKSKSNSETDMIEEWSLYDHWMTEGWSLHDRGIPLSFSDHFKIEEWSLNEKGMNTIMKEAWSPNDHYDRWMITEWWKDDHGMIEKWSLYDRGIIKQC